MKLAFSSVACPAWDLATMVEKAKEFGYDGIELRGLQGRMHLPVVPEIASNPGEISRLVRAAGVEIVCLATSAAFHMADPKAVAENQASVRETVELRAFRRYIAENPKKAGLSPDSCITYQAEYAGPVGS